MEWGLHEDKAMWNGDCVRMRSCGTGDEAVWNA